jgi:hypothetical protein
VLERIDMAVQKLTKNEVRVLERLEGVCGLRQLHLAEHLFCTESVAEIQTDIDRRASTADFVGQSVAVDVFEIIGRLTATHAPADSAREPDARVRASGRAHHERPAAGGCTGIHRRRGAVAKRVVVGAPVPESTRFLAIAERKANR